MRLIYPVVCSECGKEKMSNEMSHIHNIKYKQIEMTSICLICMSKLQKLGHKYNGAYKKRTGKIYFIKSEMLGMIKIGFTLGDVNKRISSIQSGSADKVTLIKWVNGTEIEERKLHRLFEDCNCHREWFYPKEKLLKYIESL